MMGDKSAIEWTDATWNCLLGCSRVSAGCAHCYAELLAYRLARMGNPNYAGLTKKVGNDIRWTGEVRFVEEALDLPLRWKRPRRIFVNSMSDLFHEKVEDYWQDQIFAVIALAHQHTFQILTKRPERMLAYLNDEAVRERIDVFMWEQIERRVDPGARRRDDIRATAPDLDETWPLPNVWLGVSVEDQATADERIPLLLQTPAAVRWISYEPALGPVDLRPFLWKIDDLAGDLRVDWVVIGGESGPGARPFDLAWARRAIAQCRAAGVPVFVKQLGAQPFYRIPEGTAGLGLRDRKGGSMEEWPDDLRVREFPK